MEKRIPVIWMAGDSTMQTYEEEKRPQYGWGEFLLEALEPGEEKKGRHFEGSSFEQEMRYTGRNFAVDNCAMAGRSSKSFREEGRLEEIERYMLPGDYLVIQFGHNDAAENKPERYVPCDRYQASLMNYVKAARNKGAVPLLASPILLLECEQTRTGEAGEVNRRLDAYRILMGELAERENIFWTNLADPGIGLAQEDYLEDGVHLRLTGAKKVAEAFAKGFLELERGLKK